MLHLFMGNDAWFRAKSYGLGAGLPIRWQGWVLLVSYLGAVGGAVLLFTTPNGVSRAIAFALIFIVTALFATIVRKRTEGGWKWRWAGDR